MANETHTPDVLTGRSVHDIAGPIVTFTCITDRARALLREFGLDEQGVGIVEAEHAPLMRDYAKRHGLVVRRA